MAAVRFVHVSKRYGQDVTAIADLNLQIDNRELFVLLGPSGAGKSTVLRMIAGLETVSAGDLYIDDQRINDVPPRDRNVAMVFQKDFALYPHLNVYGNLAFGLQQRHLSRAEIDRRVQYMADVLDIRLHLQRKPGELSDGQRQRVALGRALAREPQVLLMDLAELDAPLRMQLRTVIAHLRQAAPVTTVYATHDQIEALVMADRIAVLDAGFLQQVGTPQALYEQPTNLFVAGFIGSPPMNFFNARLTRSGDRAVVTIGEGAEARELTLYGWEARRLADQATADGRPVIAGIRAEGLSPAGGDATPTLVGVVDSVAHLGNQQLVHLRIPGAVVPEARETTLAIQAAQSYLGIPHALPPQATGRAETIVRLAPNVIVHPGARVALAVDTTRVHVFDPDSTERLG